MYLGIRDSLRLTSKLTAKRITNAYNVWASYKKALRTGIPDIKGLPISLSIEPTTACNLRCPECPSGLRSFTRPTGKMEDALFEKIIDEAGAQLVYLTFYFQGEPYLHPSFTDLVKYASERGIYTSTSTNAHFLNEENAIKTIESGLSRLIISIDGADQETYQAYRKTGSLEKVLEGTAEIIKWKKKLRSRTPEILWQFLVVKPNEHQIPEIRQMARRHYVNHVAFKTAQIYDYANGNPLIPDQGRYSRYRAQPDGTYTIKNNLGQWVLENVEFLRHNLGWSSCSVLL